MFADGSKVPHDRTRRLIQKLAVPLKATPLRLSIVGHTAAGLADGGGVQVQRVGDLLGALAGVVAEVAQDQGAGIAHEVVGGGAVEQPPRPGGRVEGQGVVGFVDVAAGDVQYAVGLRAGKSAFFSALYSGWRGATSAIALPMSLFVRAASSVAT